LKYSYCAKLYKYNYDVSREYDSRHMSLVNYSDDTLFTWLGHVKTKISYYLRSKSNLRYINKCIRVVYDNNNYKYNLVFTILMWRFDVLSVRFLQRQQNPRNSSYDHSSFFFFEPDAFIRNVMDNTVLRKNLISKFWSKVQTSGNLWRSTKCHLKSGLFVFGLSENISTHKYLVAFVRHVRILNANRRRN